jgi:hypothetical protein
MHKLILCAATALALLSSTVAFGQQEEAPPSPGRSPVTPEAPTVAPASDPAHASPATAQGPSITEPPRAAPQQYPAVGGHFGFALPIVTLATKSTVIGKDFVNVGLTPGMTVHLDDKWAVDFEFVAMNHFSTKGGQVHGATTFVVDPGVIRKFDGFVAGLRVATEVGARTNSGLVPIFVLPFKISERAVYFVEADVPLFIRDDGHKAQFSATGLLQSGFGF